MPKPLILAIDTSCDDTSIAVVQNHRVLSNVISSQDEIHREFGGVVPILAKRRHEAEFDRVLNLALLRAKVSQEDVTHVAVTRGPGLAPALEVGIARAQQLGQQLGKPVLGINHLEGHLWSAAAKRRTGTNGWSFTAKDFPVLGLVVSGGHTEIYWVEGVAQYTHLGGTVDDAFGEAFDKVARLLGLGYPGGAALADLADRGDKTAHKLPRAMRQSGDWNVSYSGLKTAMYRLVMETNQNGEKTLTATEIQNLAASFQAAAVETLTKKVEKLLLERQPKHILLGGGAAANKQLRLTLRQLAKKVNATLHVPHTSRLLRDNAAMIGLVAELRLEAGLAFSTELDRLPRWPLETV